MDEFMFRDIKQLMMHSPAEIKAWLQSVTADIPHSKIDINWWLGLAESAYARTFGDEQPDMEWADVAITVYEQANRYSAVGWDSCTVSAMMLRARLIGILGAKSDDTILDVQAIVDWFLEGLPMSREEAENKVKIPLKELYERNPEDISNLRKIENRLNVFRELDRSKVLVDDEILAWLKIWERLP